jgi:hypothetical protein
MNCRYSQHHGESESDDELQLIRRRYRAMLWNCATGMDLREDLESELDVLFSPTFDGSPGCTYSRYLKFVKLMAAERKEHDVTYMAKIKSGDIEARSAMMQEQGRKSELVLKPMLSMTVVTKTMALRLPNARS